MALSVNNLKNVIKDGGSVIVKSSQYRKTYLEDIAKAANKASRKLIIKVDSDINTSQMKDIAKAGKGCVTFDLT